jgi:hypothetical protein
MAATWTGSASAKRAVDEDSELISEVTSQRVRWSPSANRRDLARLGSA